MKYLIVNFSNTLILWENSYLAPSKDHVQENFWNQLVVNKHLSYCLYPSITFDFFLDLWGDFYLVD